VQLTIESLEEKREKNERSWMQDLEKAYNDELEKAGKDIVVNYLLCYRE
jgi:hypothetical protein